jgi:hypothetical protein
MSLFSELLRAWRTTRNPHLAKALSKPNFALGRAIWGLDHVEIDRTVYQPVRTGDAALIVSAARSRYIVDLVACRLRDRRIATRRGVAEVLGEEWLDLAKRDGVRLPIFADPLRWLAANQCGCVILDWYVVRGLLDDVCAVACESRSLAQRLHDATRSMRRPPHIHFAKRSISHVH